MASGEALGAAGEEGEAAERQEREGGPLGDVVRDEEAVEADDDVVGTVRLGGGPGG